MAKGTYEHTQVGRVVVYTILAAAVFVVITFLVASRATDGLRAMPAPAIAAMALTFVIMIAASAVFSRLTIRVANGTIHWHFGLGALGHDLPVADVARSAVVTNPIWSGYGVRLMRNGWLYNVAGPRAVDLELRNGRHVRLGSDEPEALAQAIDAAR
jgi:hypothetical protein